jgi:hypothetical protein
MRLNIYIKIAAQSALSVSRKNLSFRQPPLVVTPLFVSLRLGKPVVPGHGSRLEEMFRAL